MYTLRIHAILTHVCYNRYPPPHVDSNILYSTLLLALLFGCVVYASATLVTDSTRSPSNMAPPRHHPLPSDQQQAAAAAAAAAVRLPDFHADSPQSWFTNLDSQFATC